jgi:hypothetical protein
MRIASFRQTLLGILALLTAALWMGGPTTTQAASNAYITPDRVAILTVPGSWTNTGVTLLGDMPATLEDTQVDISSQSLLRTGWIVKVGAEHLLILQLTQGSVGHHDTMLVRRAREGTAAASHAHGAVINGHTQTISIWAKNVDFQYGLGGFEVDLTFPPDVQYVKLTPSVSWLASTGRTAIDCFGPNHTGNTWEVHCVTWGGYDPHGPTGSGVIATATVVPPSSGTSTVSLVGSRLTDITGYVSSTASQSLSFRVLDHCPDVNLNTRVEILDAQETARRWNDRGVDCGLKLSSDIDASQTTLQINDQDLAWWYGSGCGAPGTNRPNTIAIDNETMAVGNFSEAGSPDTVTVTRAVNDAQAKSHLAGSSVYLIPSQWGVGQPGQNGYTPRRDVDGSRKVTILDTQTIAQILGMWCP